MDAWILTVGNEILNGVITDTNREAISRELRAVGVSVRGMSSSGDALEDIEDALQIASERADVIVVSGGLGPTEDDKTAQAAARFFGVGLQLDAEQLSRIEEYFRKWGRPMSSSNQKQAFLPIGAVAIPNDYGTAPGFMFEKGDRLFMFFPGIPRELVAMVRERAIPEIRQRTGSERHEFATRTLKVYGISESKLGDILKDLAEDTPDFHLAFLPRFPIIRLRLDARGPDMETAQRKVDEMSVEIVSRIQENVISDDGRDLEHIVLELLEQRGLTLAFAESITGGMMGEMVTRVPGSSSTFMGSIVSYSNEMKQSLLGVEDDVLKRFGAVSHQCAQQMARGATRACNADVAVSVTGIAGPGGGSEEKPVGTFYVGLATPDETLSRGFLLPGERPWVRTLAAMQGLDKIRRYFLGMRLHGKAEDE